MTLPALKKTDSTAAERGLEETQRTADRHTDSNRHQWRARREKEMKEERRGEEDGWGRKWRKRIKRVMGAGGTKERMRGGEGKETVTWRDQTQRERHEGQRGFI